MNYEKLFYEMIFIICFINNLNFILEFEDNKDNIYRVKDIII